MTTLTDADLRSFSLFGIGPAILDENSVRRVTDSEARGLGFGGDHAGDMAGIFYPYHDPANGQRNTGRLRRDHPDIDGNGKQERKYLCPYGDKRHLYFPRGVADLLGDVTADVVLVESEKSALAMTAVGRRDGRKWGPDRHGRLLGLAGQDRRRDQTERRPGSRAWATGGFRPRGVEGAKGAHHLRFQRFLERRSPGGEARTNGGTQPPWGAGAYHNASSGAGIEWSR